MAIKFHYLEPVTPGTTAAPGVEASVHAATLKQYKERRTLLGSWPWPNTMAIMRSTWPSMTGLWESLCNVSSVLSFTVKK
ncbi:hypothetical protein HK405_000727, partial [Cladochytrium tenue]